jgi:hypothetical protein
MARFLRFAGASLKRLFSACLSLSPPTVGQVMAGFSVLGVVGLAYLIGAAVMFFRLPSHDFLNKSFAGARAWHERGRSTIPTLPPDAADRPVGITVDKAEKTSDGFTLYTMTDSARATLLDMRGTVVHQWKLPFRRAWPHALHIKDPLPDEQIYWCRCHLYANGDLLAVYQADGDTPYGYGLAKLDKDSKLLWAYAGYVHHDVDVDEDGIIYTLTQKLVSEPPAGLEFLTVPYLTDSLVVLSPEGQELENIPIAEAFVNSPYAPVLATGSKSLQPIPSNTVLPQDSSTQSNGRYDVLHSNSVRVLSQALAANFPLFKPGQVLLSLRNIDTIAILDRNTRSVAWAARGIWQVQHDAEFLDTGHLLLYDNFGTMKETRIVEYDPRTQAVPWTYTNENSIAFRALIRGMKQRLPNGNTLIVDPDNRRLFEVTRDKEVVWEFLCPLPSVPPGQDPLDHAVNSARRYRPVELTFLKGVAFARP